MPLLRHLHQDYHHPSYPKVTMRVLFVQPVFSSENFSKSGRELPAPSLLPGHVQMNRGVWNKIYTVM